MKRLSIVLAVMASVAISATMLQASPMFQEEANASTTVYLPLIIEPQSNDTALVQTTPTTGNSVIPAPTTTVEPSEALPPDAIAETSSDTPSNQTSSTLDAAPASYSPGSLYGFNRRLRWNAVAGGRQRLVYYNSQITARSHVFASIGEAKPGSSDKFVGSASMMVDSIAPFNGGVYVTVWVNWPSALDVALDILVVNP